MPRIIPIRDLKDTGKISELCKSENQPIFVTKNGYADMVIMSADVFERIARSDLFPVAAPATPTASAKPAASATPAASAKPAASAAHPAVASKAFDLRRD